MMRIYVIYGQGGLITSYGMKRLADRIQLFWPEPHSKVTTHTWNNPYVIQADIEAQDPKTKIVLVGYSLGANCVTWISAGTKRTIDLAVCYDPSVLSVVDQPGANVKRLLLYHNNDFEPEGHAIFKGPMVEKTEVSMFHLAICYSQALHQKTLVAIDRVSIK